MPLRAPARLPVLRQVYRAFHALPFHRSREVITQPRALNGLRAQEPSLVAFDRAAQIAGQELALMAAAQLVAVLLEGKTMVRRAANELQAQFPLPRYVRRRVAEPTRRR